MVAKIRLKSESSQLITLKFSDPSHRRGLITLQKERSICTGWAPKEEVCFGVKFRFLAVGNEFGPKIGWMLFILTTFSV